MKTNPLPTSAAKPLHVFVTGATGFIGTAVVRELIEAGHSVLGLARSEAGAKSLLAVGAQVHRGDIDDLECVRRGVAMADGVIHLAFNHDFSKYLANCESDRKVIAAMGSVLAGSARPLVITSATSMANTVPGQPAREGNPVISSRLQPRAASEEAGAVLSDRGVNVSVVRLPQVHDPVKQGLVTELIKVARQKGVSAFIGEGLNRWPAAHISTTARLYRLALEKQQAGGKYHAVAEEGVSVRAIAEALARGLKVPTLTLTTEAAAAHFGWMAKFAALDLPASSAETQKRLSWQPAGPGLIADLEQMNYFPN